MVAFSNLVTLAFLLFSNVGAKESIDVKEIEVDEEYTNQRRQLMWGSGGFSWFLYTMHLCHGPGPICPSPPCGLGPHHHKWDCETNSTVTSSAVEYEEEGEESVEAEESTKSGSGQSGGEATGSTFNALFYIIAGAAVATVVGAILLKKRRASNQSSQDIEGSVARHMELLEKGERVDITGGDPPNFIEIPASTSPSMDGPTTNYAKV